MNLPISLIKNDYKASRILDLLRFLSALTVFLFHFYVPLPGYQAVMIFFVLSGYFISSTIYKALSENKWSWADYFLKRITRLWLVLLPCLVLTFIWAKIQFDLFGVSKITEYLSIKTFLGNLFFTQGILVKEYGLNGPLWSLSYEFWYYILFPCLLLMFLSKKRNMKVLYGLLFLFISFFVGPKIMEYFLVWLLGAIIPLLKPFRFKSDFINKVILTFAVIVTLCSMKTYVLFINHPNLQIVSDLSIGISFSILVFLIISFFNERRAKVKFNIAYHLAGFSYTLYLTHYPLAHFVLAWRNSPIWNFNHTEEFLVKPCLAILILLYAWSIAMLTEKQTNRVRKYISKLYKGKSKRLIINSFYKITK